jgi:hypothetical protein
MLEQTLTIAKLVSTCLGILKQLSNNADKLIETHKTMIKSLQLQDIVLERIEQKIDNQVIRIAAKSNIFILDSIRSKNTSAKNNSLNSAYQGFTELICLDPNQDTRGTSVTIPNKKLIALGYLGRFSYYCILGSYQDSITQVYEFTSLYPDMGVEIFDASFFSKEYKRQLKKIGSQIEECHLGIGSQGIPSNQLLPLLEMEEESIKKEIIKESKSCLIYLEKTKI